ncbi:peroxisomal membrane protein Pex29p [[Candida] anglica]
MDQVSSFFENILTVDAPHPTPSHAKGVENKDNGVDEVNAEGSDTDGVDSLVADDPEAAIPTSLRAKSDSSYDFSSFWPSALQQQSGTQGTQGTQGASGTQPTPSGTSAPNSTSTTDQSKPSSSFYNLGVNQSVLTDKLMEKMISMVLPMNASTTEGQTILKERLAIQKTRPSLSVNVMSKNSIQLNRRLSVAFQTLDQIIRFFSWCNPAFTMGVLLAATHVILQPILLTVVPFIYIIVGIMVPHYLVVYPPDRSVTQGNVYYECNPIPSESALAPPEVPHAIPEFSREFILNLTDLQNYMLLYVVGFDFITWITRDYLYFKEEHISIMVLIGCVFMVTHNLFVLPKVLPWLIRWTPIKVLLILNIWTITIALHPHLRNKILEWIYDEDTRLTWLTLGNKVDRIIQEWGLDYDTPTSPEDVTQEVEIFELQRLHMKTKVWELVGYSTDFYTINSPHRIMSFRLMEEQSRDGDGPITDVVEDDFLNSETLNDPTTTTTTDRSPAAQNQRKMSHSSEDTSIVEEEEYSPPIRSAASLSSIKAPIDWEFSESPWKLDLDSSAWVVQNLLEDVVDVDTDEKWVYDISTDQTESADHNNVKEEVFRRRRWIRTCTRQKRLAGELPNVDGETTRESKRSSQTFSGYFM